MTPADRSNKQPSSRPASEEAVGRPKATGSRQQMHRGQRTQTGSPAVDRTIAQRSSSRKLPKKKR